MRFWDTSALIPLMLEEPTTPILRAILAEDRHIVTSAFTVIEVASAIWRRRHAGLISVAAHQDADRQFADLSNAWTEIPVSIDVTRVALSVLSRHPLRSGDALQLGTALTAAGTSRDLAIVSTDKALIAAASAEGFPVLP